VKNPEISWDSASCRLAWPFRACLPSGRRR